MPSNPRYANTASKLNTGANIRNVVATSGRKKMENEFFVRLKAATLGKLLEPVVSNMESIYELAHEDARSVVSSVAPGAEAGPAATGNLLVYDIRPFEEYQQCHVHGAIHWERAKVNQSTDNLPKDTYSIKQKSSTDWMVVLISEDGRDARLVANIFVQRGVENTYVVDGGFLAVCAVCPTILDGHPPSMETLSVLMKRANLKMPSAPSLTTGSVSGRSEAGMTDRCSTAASQRTQATNLISNFGGGSSSGARPWK